MALEIKPLTLKQANQFVNDFHRHHKPCTGHRFSIGVYEGDKMVGAAICGRPVARKSPQYEWVEVSRLVTDGTKNACSCLYSACARIAREMGFERIQTFILEEESGISLKASGWEHDIISSGGDWNVPSRGGRRTDQPMQRKKRYFKALK